MALKKSERYSFLWQSCNELRGGMDDGQNLQYLVAGLASDIGRGWPRRPVGAGSRPLPTVNGVPIPLTNQNQHTRLTIHWLRNEHRAAPTPAQRY